MILNYASYLKERDDIALSGFTASATNELFAVGFGGLITITAAFVFLGASGIGGGFGLGFQTFPVVFQQMGGAGRWIGFAWFFLLFLAAITSSISMLQPAKAFFEEALAISSGKAIALGDLVQQEHNRARHHGFLGGHICYLRACHSADHLFRLDLGNQEWRRRT